MDKATQLAVYSSEMEARIVQGRLAEAGIQSWIRKDDAGGFYPMFQMTHGVELLVHEDDLDTARQIVNTIDPGEDELPEQDS